jgi:acetylxylan esterase
MEDFVLAEYPGYVGFRFKMQVFHGFADSTLYPQNLQEEIKEWVSNFVWCARTPACYV